MKRTRFWSPALILCCCALLVVTACGQRGPLYLPTPEDAPANSSQAADNPGESAEERSEEESDERTKEDSEKAP